LVVRSLLARRVPGRARGRKGIDCEFFNTFGVRSAAFEFTPELGEDNQTYLTTGTRIGCRQPELAGLNPAVTTP